MEKNVTNAQLDTTAWPQRLAPNVPVESIKLVLVMEMKQNFAQNAPRVATVLLDKITVPVVQQGTTVVKVAALAQRVQVASPPQDWKPLVRTSQSAPSVLKAPTQVTVWQPLGAPLVEPPTAL